MKELKELLDNKQDHSIEITSLKHKDFTFLGAYALLKYGNYTKVVECDLSSTIIKLHDILKSKETNLENYNKFLSNSLFHGLNPNTGKVYTLGEIKSSGVLFINNAVDLVYPSDNLDFSVQVIAKNYHYGSFDDIKLSEFAYIYTIVNNKPYDGYSVRGVKKETFQELLNEKENKNSN